MMETSDYIRTLYLERPKGMAGYVENKPDSVPALKPRPYFNNLILDNTPYIRDYTLQEFAEGGNMSEIPTPSFDDFIKQKQAGHRNNIEVDYSDVGKGSVTKVFDNPRKNESFVNKRYNTLESYGYTKIPFDMGDVGDIFMRYSLITDKSPSKALWKSTDKYKVASDPTFYAWMPRYGYGDYAIEQQTTGAGTRGDAYTPRTNMRYRVGYYGDRPVNQDEFQRIYNDSNLVGKKGWFIRQPEISRFVGNHLDLNEWKKAYQQQYGVYPQAGTYKFKPVVPPLTGKPWTKAEYDAWRAENPDRQVVDSNGDDYNPKVEEVQTTEVTAPSWYQKAYSEFRRKNPAMSDAGIHRAIISAYGKKMGDDTYQSWRDSQWSN